MIGGDVQQHRDVVEVTGRIFFAEPGVLALAAVAADHEQVHPARDGPDLRNGAFGLIGQVHARLHARGDVVGGEGGNGHPADEQNGHRRGEKFHHGHDRVRPLQPAMPGEGRESARPCRAGPQLVAHSDPFVVCRRAASRCGGRGIRTHETSLPTSFQDWLHRPLGQPSLFAAQLRRRHAIAIGEYRPILADEPPSRMPADADSRLGEATGCSTRTRGRRPERPRWSRRPQR